MDNSEQSSVPSFDCLLILLRNQAQINAAQKFFGGVMPVFPKILVIPDLKRNEVKTTVLSTNSAFTVVHVWQRFTDRQADCLNVWLLQQHYLCPVLWIWEPLFAPFIIHRYAAATILVEGTSGESPTLTALLAPHLTHIAAIKGAGCASVAAERAPEILPINFSLGEDFQKISAQISAFLKTLQFQVTSVRRNVLFLYDPATLGSLPPEYIRSFEKYSRHNITFAPGSRAQAAEYDLHHFDAVVFHFSIRMCYRLLSPQYRRQIERFGGLKLLLIQDEYDEICTARDEIESLGIQILLGSAPQSCMDQLYPPNRFAALTKVSVLSGYVTPEQLQVSGQKPICDRPITLGYRGRVSHYVLGKTGQEKVEIGLRMKDVCEKENIAYDISVEERDRLYGSSWLKFIGNCKAMLATESGSQLLDETGTLRKKIDRELLKNPQLSFSEIHEKYLRGIDGNCPVLTIGPKVFEAMACKTVLVMYEGHYADFLVPDKHYIVLKKDYSNLQDVLEKLRDDALLQRIADTCYEEIIAGGNYTYEQFIAQVDGFLNFAPFHSRMETDRLAWYYMDQLGIYLPDSVRGGIDAYFCRWFSVLRAYKTLWAIKCGTWLERYPRLYRFIRNLWHLINRQP